MPPCKEGRFFWGLELGAAWPENEPEGRKISIENRHMTLAFLGQRTITPADLDLFPKPSIQVGWVGVCDEVIFLPPKEPKVVAGHISWVYGQSGFTSFISDLKRNYGLEEESFLPHITFARKPFDRVLWQESFFPFPVWALAAHLYETKGGLVYEPLWTHLFIPPFEEHVHTADIAFHIQAEDLSGLFLHAQMALASHFPPLVHYVSAQKVESLTGMVTALNKILAKLDIEIGSPFKAVSFHGELQQDERCIWHWEMIVDV